MTILDHLAANMVRLRREQGISQEELAFRSELHRTYISGIERKTRNPTIKNVDAIARALKVDITILVGKPD